MQSTMNSDPGDGDRLLPAREVLRRYSISDMTLWRWLNDETLHFPRPIYIRRFRYWWESNLVRFEREHG